MALFKRNKKEDEKNVKEVKTEVKPRRKKLSLKPRKESRFIEWFMTEKTEFGSSKKMGQNALLHLLQQRKRP